MKILQRLFGRKARRDAPSADRTAAPREPGPAAVTARRPAPSGRGSPSPQQARPSPGRTCAAQVSWRAESYPMSVVGESHYQDALMAICGWYRRESGDTKTWAVIVHDSTNPHDANAIRVEIEGRQVGHLPRAQAARVAAQMREDGIDRAGCGARIRGGWRTNQHDEGLYGVKLAIPEIGWIDFGLGKEAPKRPDPAAEGPLKGKKIALVGAPGTGDLAGEMAGLGARIMKSPGKTTDYVIVAEGADPEAHGEMRKARSLLEEGAGLEILAEAEFRRRHLSGA